MTKKLFISQPMSGLTDEEVVVKRQEAILDATRICKETFGEDTEVEVLETLFDDYNPEYNHAWFLGKAIMSLSQADVAYFADGWEAKRGCKVEHLVAEEYGIEIIKE